MVVRIEQTRASWFIKLKKEEGKTDTTNMRSSRKPRISKKLVILDCKS